MKKKHTMIGSIAAVAMIIPMLLLSGVVNMYSADAQQTSRYTLGDDGTLPGHAAKIIVEINSPFGYERITSFRTFNTNNLMAESGYYTLKLQGTVMNDKRTLLHWVAQDIGNLPSGLATSVETHGGKEIKMTKAKDGATMDVSPLTGTVTLKILEGYQDLYDTGYMRQFEFTGCHVAGYHLGTLHDNDRPYLVENRLQHYEQVDFACTGISDLNWSGKNSRHTAVQGLRNSGVDREIINEKGELIINSGREYRQPIIMQNQAETEVKNIRKEITAMITLDKPRYVVGEEAVFNVQFKDVEGNPLTPDTIRAFYNGRIVSLEEQDEKGLYTFTTPELTKENHQLIVNAEKDRYGVKTAYLSLPIHRVN